MNPSTTFYTKKRLYPEDMQILHNYSLTYEIKADAELFSFELQLFQVRF